MLGTGVDDFLGRYAALAAAGAITVGERGELTVDGSSLWTVLTLPPAPLG